MLDTEIVSADATTAPRTQSGALGAVRHLLHAVQMASKWMSIEQDLSQRWLYAKRRASIDEVSTGE
jgi:hypothetical protein